MRVALRLFAQGSFALKKLRSLPFGESFGWTAYPPMASGRYSTADSNETKTLCEKILNLLGGYDGELVWSRLKIGADGSDGIDFDELQNSIQKRRIHIMLGTKHHCALFNFKLT